MADVIIFPGDTTLDIPVERVLQGALNNAVDPAIVIGRDPDGELYFASSITSKAEILWLLEKVKQELLDL